VLLLLLLFRDPVEVVVDLSLPTFADDKIDPPVIEATLFPIIENIFKIKI
jgi:hypothetical protein